MTRLTADSLHAAGRALVAVEPRFLPWIERIGPVALRRSPSHFRSLCRAVIGQQLSNKVATAIAARVFALSPGGNPRPEDVLAASDAELRGAGLSAAKTACLRELARCFATGPLRNARFSTMSDERVIAVLTEIRGIGRWTAEMFLIFSLHRPDVFPGNDLAVRVGLGRLLDREPPTPRDAAGVAAAWAPHRTVSSLYLWRIAHWQDAPAQA